MKHYVGLDVLLKLAAICIVTICRAIRASKKLMAFIEPERPTRELRPWHRRGAGGGWALRRAFVELSGWSSNTCPSPPGKPY